MALNDYVTGRCPRPVSRMRVISPLRSQRLFRLRSLSVLLVHSAAVCSCCWRCASAAFSGSSTMAVFAPVLRARLPCLEGGAEATDVPNAT